jgi:hypothetical protein
MYQSVKTMEGIRVSKLRVFINWSSFFLLLLSFLLDPDIVSIWATRYVGVSSSDVSLSCSHDAWEDDSWCVQCIAQPRVWDDPYYFNENIRKKSFICFVDKTECNLLLRILSITKQNYNIVTDLINALPGKTSVNTVQHQSNHPHQNPLFSSREPPYTWKYCQDLGVFVCDYRRGMDWWMDLLTTCIHHSELHIIDYRHTQTSFLSLLQSPLAVSWKRLYHWRLFSFPHSGPLETVARAELLSTDNSTKLVSGWLPFNTNLLVFSSQPDFQLNLLTNQLLHGTLLNWTADNSNQQLSCCQSQSCFTTGGLQPVNSSWRQAPCDPRTESSFNWAFGAIALWRGNVFTEPLHINGLHNPVVLLLRAYMLRALPGNGHCSQSHCLVTGLCATILRNNTFNI